MNTIAMRSQMRTTALKGTTTVSNKRFFAIALAIVSALLLAFIAPQHAVAQAQNTGSIYGSATDPSGAVVANATVTVVSVDHGFSRSVKTTKNGEYTLQSLAQGVYTLTVTAPGFQTYEEDGVTVDADANVKILAKLTIGEAKIVNVQTEASDVDARSSTLTTLIDNKLIEDLPIDGRNVVAMAGLLPGVTQVNAPTTATGDTSGPTYSAGGSRTTQNLLLFDGLMWNNLFFNTGVNYPPPNGLQEVSVILLQYKAQYGRNSGSVFNVITRTGTNTIHGSVWEYFNNSIFDAQDRINILPNGKAPEDNINEFGLTVGGPIKRDKIFYFGTFQEQILRLTHEGFQFTPDAHERGFQTNSPNLFSARTGTALFDNPCTNKGTGQPGATITVGGQTCASFLTAPGQVTTQCYQNTCAQVLTQSGIPRPDQANANGSGQSPVGVQSQIQSGWGKAGNLGVSPCIAESGGAFANYAGTHNYQSDTLSSAFANPPLPPGNITDAVEATRWPFAEIPTNCLNPMVSKLIATFFPIPRIQRNGLYEAVTAAPQPEHDLNVTFRIDWRINDAHTIDMRYNTIRSDQKTAHGVSGTTFIGNANYAITHDAAGSNFGNIGDTWIITPNMVNTFRIGYKRYESNISPLDNRTLTDFGGTFFEPGVPTLPSLSDSSTTGAAFGSTAQAWSDHINEDIEVLEQLAWSHGKHNFQFGANFLRLQYDNIQDYPGQESFGGVGIALSDEAMGLLSAVQANSPLTQAGVQHDFFFYAQDDWRTTAKLTLNLGVRYELPFQWYQPTGYSSTFRPGVQSTRFPGAIGGLAFPGDPGVLSSLVPTDFNGLVPRVGFAYDVFGTGKLAIQGGFGMFFDQVNANVIGVGEPFYFQTNTTFPIGGASDPLCQTVNITPAPNAVGACTQESPHLPNGFQANNPQFFPPYSLFYPDRNFRTPYVEAINLGFQYKMPHGGTVQAYYVGKFSRKLTIPFDQNPAITDCSGGYFQANPILYGNSSCNITNPGASAAGQATTTQASYQQRARYTQFNTGGGGLVDFASIGTGSYNALQTEYTQRGGKYLTMIMSYTYSKSFDLQSDGQVQAGQSSLIPNPNNVSSERGLSDFDARHIFNLGWSLDFPKLQGSWAPVRAIVNNWNFSGTYNARTGQPLNVTCGCDAALNHEPNQRPEIVPGENPRLPSNRHRAQKIQSWFNAAAFTYPITGTFSTMHRNSFTGPAFINTNMSVGRYFPLDGLRQGMKLYFRADAFNVFNTPNLGSIATSWGCSLGTRLSASTLQPCLTGNQNGGSGTANSITTGFGTVQSTTGTNGTTSSNGRKMTFSLTLYY